MIKTEAIGTLGKNAEIKTIAGKQYASFSIAISEKTKSGESKTTWINILKSDESGKLAPYLTKGTKVFISGKPTISAYISNKTNEAIADMTVWANELEFCGSPKQEAQTASQTAKSGIDNFPPPPENDDLPF